MITETQKAARTLSGTTKYTGTWGRKQVIHLLRRTMFGAKKADVDYFVNKTLDDSITELLTSGAAPSPPRNHYNARMADPDIPLGNTWVNGPNNPQLNGARMQSFKYWWMGVMAHQSKSINEKLTLFWHNHFSTQTGIVNNPIIVYRHHAMLRAKALGNFKTLVRDVTIDPCMLLFLNGYLNTKRAPDENYARELQELFTLGKSADSQYTESDVQEAARVLTGWRIDPTTFNSYFDPNQHDTNNKQFSSFFNSSTITGQTGSAGANELDDLLDMIFANDTVVAEHICRKLYRWFVYYEIDETTELNVIKPLATEFINNNWDIVPVLKMLLSSEHFYDAANIGALIKSPVDYTIGLVRHMEIDLPDSSNVETEYDHYRILYGSAAIQQQDVGDPPSVAGWPAYYQIPQFHEIWINTDTLPKRSQITDVLVVSGFTVRGFKLYIDAIRIAELFDNPEDPDLLLNDLIEHMYTLPVSTEIRTYLKSILLAGQANNSYWTDPWNDYLNDPTNTTKKNTVNYRLISVIKFLMNLGEFQLS